VIAAISFENPLGTTKESEPRPRGGSCSLEKLNAASICHVLTYPEYEAGKWKK